VSGRIAHDRKAFQSEALEIDKHDGHFLLFSARIGTACG
jgi:hypothetical protein